MKQTTIQVSMTTPYKFKSPLSCLLEEEDGDFLVTHKGTGLTGIGKARGSAIADFEKEIVYFIGRVEGLKDSELGKAFLNLKQELKSIIE